MSVWKLKLLWADCCFSHQAITRTLHQITVDISCGMVAPQRRRGGSGANGCVGGRSSPQRVDRAAQRRNPSHLHYCRLHILVASLRRAPPRPTVIGLKWVLMTLNGHRTIWVFSLTRTWLDTTNSSFVSISEFGLKPSPVSQQDADENLHDGLLCPLNSTHSETGRRTTSCHKDTENILFCEGMGSAKGAELCWDLSSLAKSSVLGSPSLVFKVNKPHLSLTWIFFCLK